jgi:hypothetical protein
MPTVWGSWARLFGAAIVLAALGGTAGAVSASGSLIRVDVDPGTPWYGFFNYQVTATQAGGFGVAWEEDTKEDQPFFPVIEGVKARVFKNNFTPAGPPKAPDMSGHIAPGLHTLFRLGTDKVLFAYSSARKISASETRWEIFGQTLAIINEAMNPRTLLISTANTGALGARSSGLFDGRGIFGWYDGLVSSTTPTSIMGRFVSVAGQPQAPNLALTLTAGFALTNIKPVGDGFVVLYRRIDGANIQVKARIFKSNGTPLSAAHSLAPGVSNLPLIAGFSDGRILVATWIQSGSQINLVGQFYNSAWATIGGAKVLIAAGVANERVDIAPHPDGGVVLARTFGTFPTYKHTVRRFDKNLNAVGSLYTVASVGFDFAKVAVLSATKAVLVFKQNPGRSRLVAQILNL